MLSGCAGSAEDCAQRRTSDAKAASLQLNPHGRRNSRRSNGATDGAVALVAAKSHKRAQPAAAGGGRSKVAKQGLVQQALAAAKDARPAGRKRPKRSDRSSVLEDAGSDFEEQPPQPPAGRTHAPHAASSSAAGPSSPGAASRSIPDELSGDEFDEDAEAAFHDTPHRMEADRRADFADRDEACEVDAALHALRARTADDGSDWSSSLDANSPRREQPPPPPQPQQPVEEEEDDESWAHLEVGARELAATHPSYSNLVHQDVCVMGAAFASDFKLVTRDAIGWRGQVSEALVAQLLFCSRDSTSSCLLLSRELMLSCPIAGE